MGVDLANSAPSVLVRREAGVLLRHQCDTAGRGILERRDFTKVFCLLATDYSGAVQVMSWPGAYLHPEDDAVHVSLIANRSAFTRI